MRFAGQWSSVGIECGRDLFGGWILHVGSIRLYGSVKHLVAHQNLWDLESLFIRCLSPLFRSSSAARRAFAAGMEGL